MIGKFIGGILTVGGGLSLGSEGPSVQLGAMTGKGFSRINQRLKTEEKLLLTCGAGAGLAAAFGAPLAGVVFTLEELHKNFSKEVLPLHHGLRHNCRLHIFLSVWIKAGIRLHRSQRNAAEQDMDGADTGHSHGSLRRIYNKTTFLYRTCSQDLIPFFRKVAVPFVMVMILAFTLPQTLGSGSQLIAPAGQGKFEAGFFAASFGRQICVFCHKLRQWASRRDFSAAAGAGSFVGRSVHGGLKPYSRIFGEVYRILCHTRNGRIFQRHSEGSYHGDNPHQRDDRHFFPTFCPFAMVSLSAYMTAEILKGGPLYEQLTERLIAGGRVKNTHRRNKILIESEVHFGSLMDGRPLSAIDLPTGCLVVSVMRDRHEIVPGGSTRMRAGDKLIILCSEGLVMDVQAELDKKCKTVRI